MNIGEQAVFDTGFIKRFHDVIKHAHFIERFISDDKDFVQSELCGGFTEVDGCTFADKERRFWNIQDPGNRFQSGDVSSADNFIFEA